MLIYNGELYNFRDLRRTLEAKGHRFHSATDSEVLLHLYAEHGTAMLEQLDGIFAFAIFDGRESGRPPGVQRGDLFIARDQLGVKPLYHTTTSDGFLFASELKALLQHELLTRTLDPVALHQHLALLWTPAPQTLLKDVFKLQPGHALLARSGSIAREWCYYDLPYGREPMRGSEADMARELHALIARAVDRQLIADVPVGAFLSGGLDSSAVVAMMRRAQPERDITCYCIGFAGSDAVEGMPPDLPYARRIASRLGVTLHSIEVQPDIIGNLEDMLYYLDEPQADPAPINALLIARQARRDGIPVLLSGAGGDDIFSGYRRHHALRLERYWTWLPGAVRAGIGKRARAAAGGQSNARMGSPALRRFVKMLTFADSLGDERMVSYFLWSTDELRRSLYSPALAAETGDEVTAAPLLESLGRIPGERDPLNRMLYLEAKHFLADHNLNYTDKMGMAAGVEVRVPLLDLQLIDYVSRIPSAMKQRGGVGKAIFKRAMEPDLPRDVIYRRKSGFGAPLRHWLRGELRERVDDALSPESLCARGLFDSVAVQRLIALDRAGRVDGAYTIFALMCVELWCREFVDRVPVPRVAALVTT
jgi:asparagine synthase (glutamine-hydrolysing)